MAPVKDIYSIKATLMQTPEECIPSMMRMFADTMLSPIVSTKKTKVVREHWDKARNKKRKKQSYQNGSGKVETLKVFTEKKGKGEDEKRKNKNSAKKHDDLPVIQDNDSSEENPSTFATKNAENMKGKKKISAKRQDALSVKQNNDNAEETLHTFITMLYNGICNPVSNCWFNAVIVSILNTYGSYRAFESPPATRVFFMDVFFPIISSLHLCGESIGLTHDAVREMLVSFFKRGEFVVGRHEDAAEFLLVAAMFMDQFEEEAECEYIYEIQTKDYLCCLSCGERCIQKVTGERCLSVGLQKGSKKTSIADLIDHYFEDELISHQCEKCGKKSSAIAHKISNTPSALAVNVKRYGNGKKSMISVMPNSTLDMSVHMENKDSSIYQLRAVVTHKGMSLNSGHYVCTMFGNDIAVEIDDSKTSVNHKGQETHKDGYIYLYENKKVLDHATDTWWPLTFVLAALNDIAVATNMSLNFKLNSCLEYLWGRLSNDQQILSVCSKLGNMLCAQLARQVSLEKVVKDSVLLDGSVLVRALLNLLGMSSVSLNAEFLEAASCGKCNSVQRQIKCQDSFICEKLSCSSIKDALDRVPPSDEYRCCGRKIDEGNVSCIAIHLPRILVMLNRCQLIDMLIKTEELYKHRLRYPLVDEYSVKAVLEGEEVRIFKGSECYSISDVIEQVSFPLPIRGNGLVILACEKEARMPSNVPINTLTCNIAKGSISEKLVNKVKSEIDVCLENVVCDSQVLSIEDMVTIQATLHGNNVSEKMLQLCFDALSCDLGSNISFLSFESFRNFKESTFKSVCMKIMTEEKSCVFVLLYFHTGVILIDRDDLRIYEMGSDYLKSPSALLKLLNLVEILHIMEKGIYPTQSYQAFQLINEEKEGELSTLQCIELACRIMKKQSLIIQSDKLLLVTFVAQCLEITLPDNYKEKLQVITDFLNGRCIFLSPLNVDRTVQIDTCLVANNGDLFAAEVSSKWLVNRIKDTYSNRDVGILATEICYQVLDFVMSEIEHVKSLFFLSDTDINKREIESIKKLLKNRSYASIHERMKLISNTRQKMLVCVPGMLLACMEDAFKIILVNKDDHWLVETPAVQGTYFNTRDYIDAIIVKQCMVKYVSKTTSETEEEVTRSIF